MMSLFAVVLVTFAFFLCTREEDDCFKSNKLVYEVQGNVTVAGIFDGHTGEDCRLESDQGLEEMAAAVWTIAALNHYHYLPGLRIGLSLFDGCGSQELSQKTLVQAMVHDLCRKDDFYNIGTLTTPEIDDRILSLSDTVNKTITRVEHIVEVNTLLEMIMQILTNLRWTTVNRVISDAETILKKFSVMTSDEGICVYDEVLINNIHAANNEVLYPEELLQEDIVSKDHPVIVVIARSDRIATLMIDLSPDMKNLTGKWILVPTDSTLSISSDDLPENTFVILPLAERKEIANRSAINEDILTDHLNHREATKSPLFIKIASSILALLRPFKAVQSEHCPDIDPESKEPCQEIFRLILELKTGEITLTPPRSLKTLPDDINNALKILEIETSDNDEMFLYITSIFRNNVFEDFAIFQIFDPRTKNLKPTLLIVKEKLVIDEHETAKSRTRRMSEPTFKVRADDITEVRMQQRKTKTDQEPSTTESLKVNATFDRKAEETESNQFDNWMQHPCSLVFKDETSNFTQLCGICQNFLKYHGKTVQTTVQEKRAVDVGQPEISWRFETWVTINASIASIGVICTLIIMAFIVIRICKGDILEGSPYFSFLILIAIIFMYSSILPFSFQFKNGKISSLPICELRIVTPTLSYSVLFSIMLSRSLMLASSDQEGGFMSHVNGYLQTVLCFFMCGVQVALTSQYWLFNSYVHEEESANCDDIYKNHKLIVLLGYSYFLIAILACVSPFMFRSKRNYKEGLFFTIGVSLVILVWTVWIGLYFLLPLEHKDAAIACGLTATATAILSCVFVPRTYLIMTAIVRYKIANALPPLGYNSAADVSEINYRSNQALYDSVTVPCRTLKIGLPNPNFYSVNPSDSVPGTPTVNNYYSTESTLKVSTPRINISGCDRKEFEGSRPQTPENAYESYDSPPSPRRVTKF